MSPALQISASNLLSHLTVDCRLPTADDLSIAINPTLCRFLAYFPPGFPRPTITFISVFYGIIPLVMSTPSLSIIIPVLNEEKYLPTLLTDLSRQTYTDFEVIVVDGQSKDRTIEKANHFGHRLQKLTILKSDLSNVCHQRNRGAAAASASLILFMDADNRLPIYFQIGR